MQRPADWLWLGIAVLAADIVVRHLVGGPDLVHNAAFVIGGAAIMWGITKIVMERY